MFVCVFIDWENIEKCAKQEYGSIIVYDEFVKAIKEIATQKGGQLVGIHAYGDFDKGTAGLMSKLVNLGIYPHHVVTKTAQEYLKGSTDIELSLDILETMFKYPHITDFLFVSGDSDLRHIIKRLNMQGKTVRVAGFENHTSLFLIGNVSDFICLNNYPDILRKVTQTDKEQKAKALLANRFVHIIILNADRMENSDKPFLGLNFLRTKLSEIYQDNTVELSEALTDCIDYDLLDIYYVRNPKDPGFPTKACKLNRESETVKYILEKKEITAVL